MNHARELVLRHVSEAQWRQQVLDWADQRGWLAYFTWNSTHSPPGFPDLVLVKGDLVLIVELKTMTGRLSRVQCHWQLALSRAKRVLAGLVWRPSDEDEILELLGPPVPSRLIEHLRDATTGSWSSTRAYRRHGLPAAIPTSRARASTKRKPAIVERKRSPKSS